MSADWCIKKHSIAVNFHSGFRTVLVSARNFFSIFYIALIRSARVDQYICKLNQLFDTSNVKLLFVLNVNLVVDKNVI